MADVAYTIDKDQKPTQEQINMIESARKMQDQLLAEGRLSEVYDDDCPETDPVTTPKRYEAMMRAVGQRNRRIAKKHA
ncbi:MAG: hypothetical protein J5829_02010 [Lachnospiraceae bacterium]|nr:hypothetical protein [Lachnospiraceae bacterium]